MKHDSKLRGLLRSIGLFARAQSGTAATEFAIIVPVFATAVILLTDIATITVGVGAMQTAMRSTAQYAMAGGVDMATAQTQGLQAWDGRPAGGTITAVRSCTCVGLAADCGTPCADNSIPVTYVQVTAAATFTGNVISKSETLIEKVRQR